MIINEYTHILQVPRRVYKGVENVYCYGCVSKLAKMISHVSFTCVVLSLLLSIVSSRLMVHYPMDLGNYVDFRQDLAGDLLQHRYDMASNLYSENIYPAAIGLPHAGLGISHVVSDPLFGGAIINDPLMMGIPQQTVYVQSPANTVATQQVVHPTGRIVQQASTQPKVTWIKLHQQNPLNAVQTQSLSALKEVPIDRKFSRMSASRSKQISASVKNVVPKKVASTVAATALTNVDIKKTSAKVTSPKTIVSKKRVPKTTKIQRGVARRQRPQFNIQSKVNTLPNNFSTSQGRSFQRGSSTRSRAPRQSRLQLLRPRS